MQDDQTVEIHFTGQQWLDGPLVDAPSVNHPTIFTLSPRYTQYVTHLGSYNVPCPIWNCQEPTEGFRSFTLTNTDWLRVLKSATLKQAYSSQYQVVQCAFKD